MRFFSLFLLAIFIVLGFFRVDFIIMAGLHFRDLVLDGWINGWREGGKER